ncbi:MAG: AMP-binding protein [Acidimicrobiales bacterium]
MTRPEYETADEMIRARLGDTNVGVLFEDQCYSWDEHAQASATRAALATDLRRRGPFHIGFLMENIPELTFWLGAGAVSGATMVGVNPTRQGNELATDIRHTDCQLIVTEAALLPLLSGLDIGMGPDRILVVDDASFADECRPYTSAGFPAAAVAGDATALLLFTSGTSGAPKAAVVTQRRIARYGRTISESQGLDASSVCYQAMPMFHSNALYAGWSPAVYVGAAMALRRRFSASGFIDDVRKFRATYFNYVGKPLSYILATPSRPDDREHALQRVLGNEGTELDIRRFSERFGVPVADNYGSTEGGVAVMRSPDQPKGVLGKPPDGVFVLDSVTGDPCPVARLDADGRLLNAEECIGEIVNKNGGTSFEGYYKNDEAVAVRTRNGWYWSGDLAYLDADGWLHFAGRDYDWLRVDGENFASAPVERIIGRFPGVVLVAVYAVPAPDVGDDVMVALQLAPGERFDPTVFDEFLRDQRDLGIKWSPRYVRVTEALPVTHTSKILKRQLRADRWECADPVWWRPERGQPLRPMDGDDIEFIRRAFVSRDRASELDKG